MWQLVLPILPQALMFVLAKEEKRKENQGWLHGTTAGWQGLTKY